MSTRKLSHRCMAAIRREYKKSSRLMFDMDFFMDACQCSDENALSIAIRCLEAGGSVEVFWADGIAFVTTYVPDADSSNFLKQMKAIVVFIVEHLLDFFIP